MSQTDRLTYAHRVHMYVCFYACDDRMSVYMSVCLHSRVVCVYICICYACIYVYLCLYMHIYTYI